MRSIKKNELFNELNKLIEGADETMWMLKQYKESWFEKLMYKKIKLQKVIKISRRIKHNTNLERDLKNFF